MSRICLYFHPVPEHDRWLPGDRFVRPLLRRVIRGKPRPGGIEKVFINLCLGLDHLGVSYKVNLPFDQLRDDDRVGMLGRGRHALKGYDRPYPIVAGNGMMTHPSEWPTLCEDYPVVTYFQPSHWANEVFRRFFGDRCRVWPVGIDTYSWRSASDHDKHVDFLIYDKIRWRREELVPRLLDPVRAELTYRGLSYREIRYGQYDEARYREALDQCRSMIFLCEHESQGIALQECLASGVPVLAWDQGWCLDPERFTWGQPEIPATSVPYFDERCGLCFRDAAEFPEILTRFLDLANGENFVPRNYVMENLTLEKCSMAFVQILNESLQVTDAEYSLSARSVSDN